MIGFDDGKDQIRSLDCAIVRVINADLTSHADLTAAARLGENSGLAYIGTQKGGKFDITHVLAEEMLNDEANPNGRPNSDVVRPWVNGQDITQRRRGMWIIDFNEMSMERACQYEGPFEYVRNHVRKGREELQSEAHSARRWWLHQRARPEMRGAIDELWRYIVTPRVAKYRLFAWLSPETLPDSATVAIARSDDYFFGVLHSRPHELWARRQGTQLREASSGSRYTPTSTFETYPFPWPPGQEPGSVTPGEESDPLVSAIADAARALVEMRDNWLNPPDLSAKELKKRTLTNLYNQRPTWLDLAHRRLDQAVFAAYDWPDDLSDEEVLERLLALNLERAAKEDKSE